MHTLCKADYSVMCFHTLDITLLAGRHPSRNKNSANAHPYLLQVETPIALAIWEKTRCICCNLSVDPKDWTWQVKIILRDTPMHSAGSTFQGHGGIGAHSVACTSQSLQQRSDSVIFLFLFYPGGLHLISFLEIGHAIPSYPGQRMEKDEVMLLKCWDSRGNATKSQRNNGATICGETITIRKPLKHCKV